MSQTSYVLIDRLHVIKHSDDLPWWFGDYAEDDKTDDQDAREFTTTDAMAASGDCFITLATRLDKVAQGLLLDSAEQIELEYLVSELFYLQEHWQVAAKPKQR